MMEGKRGGSCGIGTICAIPYKSSYIKILVQLDGTRRTPLEDGKNKLES